MATMTKRTLGRTGAEIEAVSLGGEGILRTVGRHAEAVPMIVEALRLGVRYCDTAPAYSQSQDYYGEAFRAAGPGARERVFLASKTHARDRDGSLRLLDDSLRRLGTDHRVARSKPWSARGPTGACATWASRATTTPRSSSRRCGAIRSTRCCAR
jgi:diketogulonate reductase-like aldo/keto reductase